MTLVAAEHLGQYSLNLSFYCCFTETEIQLVNLRNYFVPSVVLVFSNKMLFSHTIFLHTNLHGDKIDLIKDWYWKKIIYTFQSKAHLRLVN